MKHSSFWLVLSLVVALSWSSVSFGQAQSPIVATISGENAFPIGIVFALQASTSAGEITDARVTLQPVGSTVRQNIPFDFEPAPSVTSEVHFNRLGTALPPAALVEYWVTVRDSAGNHFRSEPRQLTYLREEYDWQELTRGDATFVWYEGSQAWAEEMVALAAPAVERAAQTYGVEVQVPMRIVAFPDDRAFHEAMPDLQSWAGGVTLADFGMTIQVISPGTPGWNEVVIPHEIAHLVFDRATRSTLAPIPNWLSEGLAMLNEPGDHTAERAAVEQAARDGNLYRLSELRSESFGDHSQVGLGYAQGWSMANFLVESCGEEGFHAFIAVLNTGKALDDAMTAACGFDEQTLYNNWYASLTGGQSAGGAGVEVGDGTAEPPSPVTRATPARPGISRALAWAGAVLLVAGLILFGGSMVLLVGLSIVLARTTSR